MGREVAFGMMRGFGGAVKEAIQFLLCSQCLLLLFYFILFGLYGQICRCFFLRLFLCPCLCGYTVSLNKLPPNASMWGGVLGRALFRVLVGSFQEYQRPLRCFSSALKSLFVTRLAVFLNCDVCGKEG